MKSKNKFLLLIFLAAIGSLGFLIIKDKTSCNRLSCLAFKDQKKYEVKSIYEENEYIFRALYKNQDNMLRIEVRKNSTQDESNKAIQTQLVRTKGIFELAAAPYPGEISDVIACSDKYKPIYRTSVQNGLKISYFEGYLNDRLVFGSCVDDQAKYHDTLAMFYCPNQKNFYQIEIITSSNEFRHNPNNKAEILKSIACK